MKKQVLLIDDEHSVMDAYERALELGGFEVQRFYGPDELFAFVSKQERDIAVVVLDIMMLPGKRYENADTDEGLRTGILVYNDLRAIYPETPIIILTNVTNGGTLAHFAGTSGVTVVQKIDYSPYVLLNLVRAIVGQEADIQPEPA